MATEESMWKNWLTLSFSVCSDLVLHLTKAALINLDAEEKSLLSMLFEEGLSCYRLADERNPLLQKLERVEGAPFGSSQMTKNLLEIFLIKLCRNTDVVTKKMRRSYQIDGVDIPYDVKEVLDVLKGKVYDRISVKEVAKAVGKSESTVKQLFARYRKGGMMQYYNALKISEAKKLIREGKYNITQISDLLHFDNPQYFSKCFKKFTRMTPGEYKSSILGEYQPAK